MHIFTWVLLYSWRYSFYKIDRSYIYILMSSIHKTAKYSAQEHEPTLSLQLHSHKEDSPSALPGSTALSLRSDRTMITFNFLASKITYQSIKEIPFDTFYICSHFKIFIRKTITNSRHWLDPSPQTLQIAPDMWSLYFVYINFLNPNKRYMSCVPMQKTLLCHCTKSQNTEDAISTGEWIKSIPLTRRNNAYILLQLCLHFYTSENIGIIMGRSVQIIT